MSEHVYEYQMPMVARIQMRIGRVDDQIRGVRDLMHQNRNALHGDPAMFREYLDRIQTVLTDMYAQIQQAVDMFRPAAPQRNVVAERRPAAPQRDVVAERRPLAPRRHDHLADERRLNTDDTYDRLTALMRAAVVEEDVPLGRAQLLHPRVPRVHQMPIDDIDDDRDTFGSVVQHRSRKRNREGFGRKSKLY